MSEREKAEEMYQDAIRMHGIEKAKQEALNSAKAIHALAPYRDGKMKARDYWEKVINYLNRK